MPQLDIAMYRFELYFLVIFFFFYFISSVSVIKTPADKLLINFLNFIYNWSTLFLTSNIDKKDSKKFFNQKYGKYVSNFLSFFYTEICSSKPEKATNDIFSDSYWFSIMFFYCFGKFDLFRYIEQDNSIKYVFKPDYFDEIGAPRYYFIDDNVLAGCLSFFGDDELLAFLECTNLLEYNDLFFGFSPNNSQKDLFFDIINELSKKGLFFLKAQTKQTFNVDIYRDGFIGDDKLINEIISPMVEKSFKTHRNSIFFTLNFFFLSLSNLFFIQILLQIVLLLGAIAFFTLGERKFMAAAQRRKGPNTGIPYGLGQPIADGVKLLLKEVIIPRKANIGLFFLAPLITFVLSLWHWVVLPFSSTLKLVDFNFSVLYTLAISSLSVYGLIIAGWASNSKYAFLGAIRATSQMISYELSMGFTILPILLLSNSLNYTTIIMVQKSVWFIFPLLPLFILFSIIMLAETNRTPFDLAEAEAELVAGYNVEYSSILFAFFFLGEYSNMIIMSALITIFFLGGWLPLPFFFQGEGSIYWFIFKIIFFCIFFVWVRATLPRYRYDQLMHIGWKIILPFSMGFFFFLNGFIIIYYGSILNIQNPFLTMNNFYKYFFLRDYVVSEFLAQKNIRDESFLLEIDSFIDEYIF